MQSTQRNPKKILIIIGFVVYIILALVLILKTSARAESKNMHNAMITGADKEKEIQIPRNLVEVALNGVTRYQITELFNEILQKTPGVVQAKRHRFILDPENPQRCRVDWQLEIKDTDPFQLEGDVHRSLLAAADIKDKPSMIPGQFSEEIRAALRQIKPLKATSRQLQFYFLHKEIPDVKNILITGHWSHWPDMGFD